MLLDRAADLTAKITQYQKLKGAADESKQFQTRADQFASVADRIAGVRKRLDKLATAGVAITFEPSDGALCRQGQGTAGRDEDQSCGDQ